MCGLYNELPWEDAILRRAPVTGKDTPKDALLLPWDRKPPRPVLWRCQPLNHDANAKCTVIVSWMGYGTPFR